MIKWLSNWGWFTVGSIGYAITFAGAGFAFTENKSIALILLSIGGFLVVLGILLTKSSKKIKSEKK